MEERKILLVGAHPSPVRFNLYTQWETLFDSPCQVLEMAMESDASPENSMVQEIFHDGGGFLSGSSVAAFYGEKLLIGTTTQQILAVCDFVDQTE